MKVTGPGRCAVCSWHVVTQGHAPHCPPDRGYAAYRAGICTVCQVNKPQAGSPKCAECWPIPTIKYIPPQYIEADLTDDEAAEAEHYGRLRHTESRRRGLTDRNESIGKEDPVFVEIVGVYGEIAVARYALKVQDWVPTVNNFDGPDIAYRNLPIQVRTSFRHHYQLLIRPKDGDDDIFILATWNKATPAIVLLRVHGYLLGADAKKPRYRDDSDSRLPMWLIPQNELHPITDLTD